jgi:RNA polymerase sigma factor (sigma-70 family)
LENDPGSRHGETVLPDERVAQLRRQLLVSVRRSCPGWLADRAEDIVQATLIRLLDAHRKSGGNLPLNPSYLSRVAYNAMVDEVRRHFKRKEVPEDERLRLDHTAASTVNPERGAIATEIHQGIRDCLAAMIPSRRMSVACHLIGYSVPETARFLGWTPKKVEHLIRRGLADLRACLATKGLTP